MEGDETNHTLPRHPTETHSQDKDGDSQFFEKENHRPTLTNRLSETEDLKRSEAVCPFQQRFGQKISFGGIPNSCNVLFLQIFPKHNVEAKLQVKSAWSKQILRKSQKSTIALMTSMYAVCTCMKTKRRKMNFSGTFSATFSGTRWTWPGPAPKIPETFSGTFSATFSGTRWTWLGFAPRLPGTFSGTFSATLLPGSAPKPPRTFPGTFPGTFSGSLLNLTWLCTKASHTFSRTFSGTLLNLTWLCTKAFRPSPEPSSEPCWTWPGSAPKPPRPSPEPSEPSWTWPGACTSAHRSYSGLKTPLAYAVGDKKIIKVERCWKHKLQINVPADRGFCHIRAFCGVPFRRESCPFCILHWHCCFTIK